MSTLRVFARVRALLEHRRWPLLAALLAVVLVSPAIATGLHVDDRLHRAIFTGVEPYASWWSSPLSLFTFFDGDPSRNAEMMRAGVLPWWSDPELRIAFFRPLSAATHALDYQLFPNAPWAMHLHGFVWGAALVVGAGVLYRRVLGATWVAGLAALFYAVDDGHAVVFSWVANRNAAIAAAFGVFAIVLHDRAVRSGSSRSRLLAPLLLALGLLAGETALGAVGFLVSHALFLDPANLRRRLLRLVPYAIVLLGWAAAYRLAGCGTAGSALYVDPIRHPVRFLAGALQNAPLLLLGALTPVPPDPAFFAPRGVVRFAIVASLAVVAVLAIVARPLLRRSAAARFFALGGAVALLPACATVPSGRLLLFVSLGAFGLLAEVVAEARTALARVVARASLVAHLGIAPVLCVLGTFTFPLLSSLYVRAEKTLPLDATIATKDVVFVNAMDALATGYVIIDRKLRGDPAPRSTRVLAVGQADVEVERVDARTLRVHVPRGWLSDGFSRLVRDPRDGFDRLLRADRVMSVEIERLGEDGRPTVVLFRFDRVLEDSTLLFVRWDGAGYVRFQLPAIGERVPLPARHPLACGAPTRRRSSDGDLTLFGKLGSAK